MATPNTLPTTPQGIPANLLPDMHGTGFSHTEATNEIIDNVYNAWVALGQEGVTSSDVLAYLRMHDGVNKGLNVPISALLSPSLIINGNYDIWQRTVSAAQTCTTTFNILTSFGPDRLYTLPVGASVTVQRSTTVPANGLSLYSAAITGAASVTTVDHGQRIHSTYRHRYKTSQMFGLWVRNESGAAFTPNLRVDTPAAADDWTTPTNRLDQPLQPCADAAWTFVHYVFDPSAYTNIDNGMSAYLRIPSGSLTAGKIVRVAQFDLRPGSQARLFIPPDPREALIRCQAYYLKTFAQATAPAQAAGVVGALSFNSGFASTGLAGTTWRFPVVMVKTPTVVTFNPVSANALWRDVSINADSVSATPGSIGDSGCYAGCSQAASAVAGSSHVLHATANAELS